MSLTYLSSADHKKRIEYLQEKLNEAQIDTYIVFNSNNIFYLTGFAFIPTERPLAVIVNNGEVDFFVPGLEVQHVSHQVPFVKEIYSYFDYPDHIHPIQQLVDVLNKEFISSDGKIDSESTGAPGYWGYKGPRLEEVYKRQIKLLPDLISEMRVIKDDKEVQLLRESSKWAAKAHEYLQAYTKEHENEIDVSIRASQAASNEMQRSLGENYRPRGWTTFPAHAGYRGQIGVHSAFPHATTQGLVFEKGDVVVTGASSNVYGYNSELERTMFIGEPSPRQKELFTVMLQAQNIALETIRPGVTCADVDKKTRAFIKDKGYLNLLRHHTGHSLGLEGHERPFLDIGDKTELRPGMVFSCEPGLYEINIGGFRHSDTFVVTEDGNEVLTQYPRELSDLIIN